MSETMKELYTALAKAQGQIEGASKERENSHFKSKYADLASVWDAIRAPLSANGLCVVQLPEPSADGKMVLRTILAHSSGAQIETVYPLNPVAQTPQGYGSAITYARRYTLMAITGVAPEDDDGNAASGHKVETQTRPLEREPDPQPDALSKAAARPIFDRMIKEYSALKTVTDLDAWWVGSKRDRLSMPEDWRQELAARWTAHKKSILDALSARHGIPADTYQDAAQ